MPSDTHVTEPLALPCGAVLSNRVAKAAMTERLTFADGRPHEGHERLYAHWARGGAGLMLTGNIMVDRRSLESAGNVIVEGHECLPALRRWASAATARGQHCWAQLSHPGRQTSVLVNARPVSSSNVRLEKLGFFGRPRALTEGELGEVLDRFVRAAELCQRAGFTGVQVHAAHGYLLSQFLSPLTNLRADRWGGALEHRARLLLEVVRGVRRACGSSFPVSVKLNSADFQRGGFDEEDSLRVLAMLESEGVDLLELSGGTYEKAVFFEAGQRESTRKREGYFLEFAARARTATKMPLMLTGGFRTRAGMQGALGAGVTDVVGAARPFLFYDDFAGAVLRDEALAPLELEVSTGVRKLDDLAEAGVYDLQLKQLAAGGPVAEPASPLRGAVHLLSLEFGRAMSKRFARR